MKRARWYDPRIGRWLSEDPIGFAAGDGNLYRYVGNEPTNAIDPDGRVISWIAEQIGLPLAKGTALEGTVEWGLAAGRSVDVLRHVGNHMYSRTTATINAARAEGLGGATKEAALSVVKGHPLMNTVYNGVRDHGANHARGQGAGSAYLGAAAKNSVGTSTVWGLVEAYEGKELGGVGHGRQLTEEEKKDRVVGAIRDLALTAVTFWAGSRPTRWHNHFADKIAQEMAKAAELGIRPIKVTSPASIAEVAADGRTFKWVVVEKGDLLALPKVEPGDLIKHSVATEGRPVLAAGNGKMQGPNRVVIDKRSGHYQPDPITPSSQSRSLQLAKKKFEAAGFKVAIVEGVE